MQLRFQSHFKGNLYTIRNLYMYTERKRSYTNSRDLYSCIPDKNCTIQIFDNTVLEFSRRITLVGWESFCLDCKEKWRIRLIASIFHHFFQEKWKGIEWLQVFSINFSGEVKNNRMMANIFHNSCWLGIFLPWLQREVKD